MIESYLKSLINEDSPDDKEEIKISSFIKNLSTGVKIPADLDYIKRYGDYLSEKYK